jgi:hypothetical protein
MTIRQPEERTDEEEARYRRLIISLFDFREAVQFLSQFIAIADASTGSDRGVDEMRRALTIASIIAYARPFTRNYGAPSVARSISVDEVGTLTAFQRQLHEQLMTRRNRAYAHSDAEMAELTYDRDHPNGPVPRVSDPRIAFTNADAFNVRNLAQKLSTWCTSEAVALSGVYVIGSRRAAPQDLA